MDKKLKVLGLSLGLVGLLVTGCSKLQGEDSLSQGKIDGNAVRLVKENISWEADIYRLEVYDKDGKIRITARGRYFPDLMFAYDDGRVVVLPYGPSK